MIQRIFKYVDIMTRHILCLTICLATLTACSSDDDDKKEEDLPSRTVLLYAVAENRLSEYFDQYVNGIKPDYEEMLEGAKHIGSNNFLVFVDKADASNPPYISRIDKDGAKVVYRFPSDFCSVDAERMKIVMQWVVSHYPAKSYGLCFWGHGDGMLWTSKTTNESSARSRAYGYDNEQNQMEDNGKGINIPTLANVINSSMPHLDFIFWDCCCMQNLECDYELRNVCDYIIASPAEIPGVGAPYEQVLPDLFLEKEKVGRAVVDDYIKYSTTLLPPSYGEGAYKGAPLSVVKTEALENLVLATSNALHSSGKDYSEDLSTEGTVFYFTFTPSYSLKKPIMHDIKDVMRTNLTPSDYEHWTKALNEAVVYSRHPLDCSEIGTLQTWESLYLTYYDFQSFKLTDESYSGLSFYVPNPVFKEGNNRFIAPQLTMDNYSISKILLNK